MLNMAIAHAQIMEKMKFTHQTRLKSRESQLVQQVKLRAIYSVT